MSKGFCILAQNNPDTDYVRQAYALALSIHKFNKDQKVSLITNDKVPKKYQKVFDKIIKIPWNDQAELSHWKIENRWKVYHVTPYEYTIVMDADMLVLHKISQWWNFLSERDLFFVSNVRNFRNEIVTSRHYRKTFDANNLPDLYSAIHYFKKCDYSHSFFTLLELIVVNWELFYDKCAPDLFQQGCSIDLCCSIASKILNNEKEITQSDSTITFTHMKPHLQGWHDVPEKWTKSIGSYLRNDKTLLLGNYIQNNVLHYVDQEFLTDKFLKRLESL